MTNAKAEYRESLAAAAAPARVLPRQAASVAPLAADLRPALEAAAAAEPEPQRAAWPEQESAPASPRLLPGLAARSAVPA
jgi:hypothetical protein